jgi:GNAT superfamily N-acetyltransferase
VHEANPTYPPPQDVDGSRASLREWLLDNDHPHRWVALVDGVVAGHVQVVPPHAYLTDHLASVGCSPSAPHGFAEVVKLFVDPDHGSRGLGTALLAQACAVAERQGRQAALAVVVTSIDALRLYERSKLRDVGSFDGVHGENRVFVETRSGPRASQPD